jgi:RimJ/RimL family protein N-acetyltransferase
VSLDRIETRSLILSAHTVENAEDAYRVESNPKVMQFLGGEYRCPKEQFLRDFPARYVDRFPEHMAVRRKGDWAYIGNCSLTECRLPDRDSQPLVAAIQPRIVIDEPHWRNMYGVEVLRALLSHAFGPMQANIVAGVIDPRHPRMHELCTLYLWLPTGPASRPGSAHAGGPIGTVGCHAERLRSRTEKTAEAGKLVRNSPTL